MGKRGVASRKFQRWLFSLVQASLADEAIKFAEEADGDDDDDDDDDLDLPDTMKAAHFYPFKQFFTQARRRLPP